MALVQGFAQEAWQRRMLRRNNDDKPAALADDLTQLWTQHVSLVDGGLRRQVLRKRMARAAITITASGREYPGEVLVRSGTWLGLGAFMTASTSSGVTAWEAPEDARRPGRRRASCKLDKADALLEGHRAQYVMTRYGPEPLGTRKAAGMNPLSIYAHYLAKQPELIASPMRQPMGDSLWCIWMRSKVRFEHVLVGSADA